MELFALASFAKQNELPITRLDSTFNHQQIQLKKQGTCVWCQYKSKLGQKNQLKQAGCSDYGCSAWREVPLGGIP
jgi:hypothetical protein